MNIAKDIKELADLIERDTRENGGASHTIDGQTPPAHGYMVGILGTEERVPLSVLDASAIIEYIGKHLDKLAYHPHLYVGTWLDEETNEVCLDLSLWEEVEKRARVLGVAGKQKAIYNLATGQSITL